MLVLRCTARLLERLSVPRNDSPPPSTTRLGDWYANLLAWRPRHLVLLVNETTRLPVVVPARPLSTLGSRVSAAIAAVLQELGVERAAVDAECREMEGIVFAKTASRSVLGTSKEFAFYLEQLHASRPNESEHKLSLLLGDTLVTVPPLGFEYPGELVQELFGTADSDRVTVSSPHSPGLLPRDSQKARVLQLKITLLRVQPPIWRRIHVRSDLALDMFHRVVQVTMGWSDEHLHEFLIGTERIGPIEDAPDFYTARESMRRLGRSLRNEGDRFFYLYDHGDNWAHEILLERVLDQDAGAGYPRVIDGARACPPENCGGWAGYDELLNALADDEHPDHADVRAFVGHGFDPDAFDPGAVNNEMAARGMVWPRPAPPTGPVKTRPRLRLVQ